MQTSKKNKKTQKKAKEKKEYEHWTCKKPAQ